MKKAILITKFFMSRHTDNYMFLFNKMKKELDFDVICTDAPDLELLKRYNLIMLHAIPHHGFQNYPLEPFLRLPRDVKLIGRLRDIHLTYRNNTTVFKSRTEKSLVVTDEILNRFDVILHFSDEYFRNNYSKFIDKAVYLPQFFAPYERYNFDINNDPIKKILLSGSNSDSYPIRHRIYTYSKSNRNIVDVIQSKKRAGAKFTGDEYAKLLRRYLGVIASGGKMRYAIAKYVEIPAAGALLLGEDIPDVRLMGFEPGKHFIPIDYNNVIPQMAYVIDNYESFTDMRKECRELVWKNHGLDSRFNQIKDIIENRL